MSHVGRKAKNYYKNDKAFHEEEKNWSWIPDSCRYL